MCFIIILHLWEFFIEILSKLMQIVSTNVFVYLRPTTNAIMGLTFARYVIQPFFTNCSAPDDAVRILAAVTICKIFPAFSF